MGRGLYAATGLAGAGFINRSNTRLSPWWEDIKIRSQLVESWLPEAVILSSDTENTPYAQLVRNASVMAVALVTYRFAENASEFWAGLVRDDALPQGDPRKALLMAWADKTKFRRAVYQQHIVARYVMSAWNSFRRGQTRSNISYGNLEVPVTIRDTPHNGKATMTYVSPKGVILKEPIEKE
jgi:hypothetical protein